MADNKIVEEMAKDVKSLDDVPYHPNCNYIYRRAEKLKSLGYIKQKWISVDERLPENEQMVLTIDTEGEMQVCFYETVWEGIFQQFHGLVKIYNITHWMPLPEPPETKGETE